MILLTVTLIPLPPGLCCSAQPDSVSSWGRKPTVRSQPLCLVRLEHSTQLLRRTGMMVKDRRLMVKISKQGSHVTTSRGHTSLSSTSCLTQHKRKQQSKETRKPYLRSNLENWVYQTEARVGIGKCWYHKQGEDFQ